MAYGSVLGVLRSLGSRGVPVYVLIVNHESSVLSASRYCYKVITINLEGDSEKVCKDLVRWCRDQDFRCRPFLLPLTDNTCTYIAEGRAILEEEFLIALDKSNVILDLLDKGKATELAVHNGLAVPQSGTAASMQELIDIAEKVHFPVIVKPTMWRSRGKTHFKTLEFEEKNQLLTKGQDMLSAGAVLLVQEYIPGGDKSVEFFLFYRSRDGGDTTISCTGTKIRQYPPGAGIMASGKTVWLPHVAKMSIAFLERIGFYGLGGIEYKRYNDKSYFIEINTRLEAIHPLAIKSGIDFPWYVYSDMVLKQNDFDIPKQKTAYYLNEFTYLALLGNYFNKVPVFREVLGILTKPSVCFAVWKINDPRPMVMRWWQIIQKTCRAFTSRIITGMMKKA